jgi:hypothetical protein
MKPRTFLLLSLAGNLTLAAAAYHVIKPKKAHVGDSASESVETRKTEAKPKGASDAGAQPSVLTNYIAEEFTWHQIEAQDYKDYIANLRAVGCPEETIRDIIVADVNKLFAPRFKMLRTAESGGSYWKSQRSWNSKEGYERQKQYRALEKEKTAMLVELLGVDPNRERNRELGYPDYRNYSFLTPEKNDKARQIQEKFEEQRQELYRNGIYDEADQKALRDVHAAEMAEMAQFMTPQELEQYELRTSQTASQLRYDLDGFEPSENEFREIFKLRKEREEDLAHVYDPDDKVGQERRKKAAEEVDEQIKAQLGEARFDEYKLSQDWSYKELVRLADRAGLAKDAAKSVYDVKKIVEDQVKKVREDKTLSSEQRSLALQAIRAETEKTVVATLGGEKNYNRYKSRGGYWVSNIAPTPRPTKTTP